MPLPSGPSQVQAECSDPDALQRQDFPLVQKRWGWIVPVWTPDPVFQGPGKQGGLQQVEPCGPNQTNAKVQVCWNPNVSFHCMPSTSHSSQHFRRLSLPVPQVCLLEEQHQGSLFLSYSLWWEASPFPWVPPAGSISSWTPWGCWGQGQSLEWVDCEVSQEGKRASVGLWGTENTDSL